MACYIKLLFYTFFHYGIQENYAYSFSLSQALIYRRQVIEQECYCYLLKFVFQLTEKERAEMRQHRREAVKCEAKMFERRRERYSDLLLQVMSVVDRIQVRRQELAL